METNAGISAIDFCSIHQVDISFVSLLGEYDLIHPFFAKNHTWIQEDEIPVLEKMVRLHYEMGINLEGIEAVNHLLQKLETMQQQILTLQNKLAIYEE